MKFPGAPYGLKMACGENPKRVYAQRGPSTRMGNVAGYRAAWIQAEQYRRKWDKLATPTQKGERAASATSRIETLAEVLRGNILVHNHCYRADEMAQMLDIAKEFGYKIRSFHHVRRGLQDRRPAGRRPASPRRSGPTGAASRWRRSTASRPTPRSCSAAGARAIIHSDDPSGSQRLNQEAAKAMAAGAALGLPVAAGRRDQVADASTRRGRSASTTASARSSRARTPTSCCGPAIRSASTRAPRRSGSTARCASTASAPDTRWRTDFELGFVPAEAR